jgi:hypothetical protein
VVARRIARCARTTPTSNGLADNDSGRTISRSAPDATQPHDAVQHPQSVTSKGSKSCADHTGL